ncbi:hypothetical protein K1T71_014802 [Dendrolimus kikuchii]|nr:hypothetical protein K1T71_014802 [Dendrolimus kikuchii]
MCSEDKSSEYDEEATYLHFVEDSFPLSHRDVARETKKDPILCKIYSYIVSGWPNVTEIENEKPYFHRKETLYTDHGCVVWGYRIVIPRKLRERVVEEIHTGHVGIVRMKQIARNYVWWPQIDKDIEIRARSCVACNEVRDAPPHATPVPYVWPPEPWVRLHADFLYHHGDYYLLVIDAHSKWIEVNTMRSGTTASLVITKFRELFSRFGIPRQLVTDGGPPFTSAEFEQFLKKNGIQHVLTAPYHPSSNGAAENAVKTIKKVLKKARAEGVNAEIALSKFLLQYRNSSHSSTQREPAVAMIGRRLRTRLDLLRTPSPQECVAKAQCTQVAHSGGTHREFNCGDQVLVKNFSKNGPNWKDGIISKRTGAVTYEVATDNDKLSTKHADQLISAKPKRYSWALTLNDESGNKGEDNNNLNGSKHIETLQGSPASSSTSYANAENHMPQNPPPPAPATLASDIGRMNERGQGVHVGNMARGQRTRAGSHPIGQIPNHLAVGCFDASYDRPPQRRKLYSFSVPARIKI